MRKPNTLKFGNILRGDVKQKRVDEMSAVPMLFGNRDICHEHGRSNSEISETYHF